MTNSLPYAIVLYGCDTRAVTEQMETSIKSLEWKILSNINGPTEDQNGWRIRNNGTFHAACGKPNIVTTIKVRRLELAGNSVRKSDDWAVKTSISGKPD
jgi:hypothetical protein